MNETENNIFLGCIAGVIFNAALQKMHSEEGGGDSVNLRNVFDILLSPVSVVGFCGGGLGVMLGHQLFGAPLGAFSLMGMSLVGVIVFDKFLTI